MDLCPHILHVVYCPLRQATHQTYFVEVQKTIAAADNREEMRFSFCLSKASAAPDLKNETAQRSVDDVTP